MTIKLDEDLKKKADECKSFSEMAELIGKQVLRDTIKGINQMENK